MAKKNTCVYVLGGPAPLPWSYCGKPVSKGRRKRHFCDEHTTMVDSQLEDESEFDPYIFPDK